MNYCMYYLVTDDEVPSAETIAERLADGGLRLEDRHLFSGETSVGHALLLSPRDDGFDAVRDRLDERAAAGPDAETATMLRAMLRNLRAIVSIEILAGEPDMIDETLSRLEPLWDWLETSFDGLVYAEGEGFYDQGELILESE